MQGFNLQTIIFVVLLFLGEDDSQISAVWRHQTYDNLYLLIHPFPMVQLCDIILRFNLFFQVSNFIYFTRKMMQNLGVQMLPLLIH